MTAARAYSPFGSQPLAPRIIAAANDNLPTVVALAGAAGSGKSTAASYLVDRYGYTRVRFAGPLKAMMASLGFTFDEIEGDKKEVANDKLCGKSPRHAMQTLGSEWGRGHIGEEFWTRLWKTCANEVLDEGGRVVVDDCRFPNEARMVRSLGGDIYRLAGRGGISGTHQSERQSFLADLVIDNTGTREELHAAVDEALVRYA